jgi:lysyl-tRNA synthetase, class II
MSKSEEIVPERLEKLKKIIARGINPYPNSFHRTHSNAEALALFQTGEKEGTADIPAITLAGRITAMRLMGKLAFADIKDFTGRIQFLFKQGVLSEDKFQLLKDIDIGDFVGATGKLFRTRTGEVTLEVADYTLLTKSLHALPEKWHGLVDVEKRYRQRYLDLISNDDIKHLFYNRSKIITAVRRFLNDRGFIEVETPTLQQLAGGAMAQPFITHHHALDQDLYLRIALELYLKRLIVGGMDKVYEIGRVFRNEGISTKHNPEFSMLETYEAYADYNDTMAMVENMFSYVATEVFGKTEAPFNGGTIDFKAPWPRISLRDIVKEKSGIDYMDYPDGQMLGNRMREMGMQVDPSKDKGKLIDQLVSDYVEPGLIQPVFLIDYPIEMSPLAKTKPDDAKVVERFEAFIGGIEVANSFTELNDPLEQERRFFKQFQHLTQELNRGDREEEVIDDDFLLALEYGMPPTGGLGIGIDRMVMMMTDRQSIREVILFPQLKDK